MPERNPLVVGETKRKTRGGPLAGAGVRVGRDRVCWWSVVLVVVPVVAVLRWRYRGAWIAIAAETRRIPKHDCCHPRA